MNREMRRLQEREERRKKRKDGGGSRASRQATAVQARPKAPAERTSIFRRIAGYLHEVRLELSKVTWPTREQMIAYTTVTMITTVFLTAVIFGLDVAVKDAVLWLVERRR
ncbi:MAG TPA: preprotein translocase subunit SecE [Acidimicrobiia bacterium]|nr:preprotein translocase subunit SecE [Acidimicrobiia bacterium]